MCHHFWMEEDRTPDPREREKMHDTDRKLRFRFKIDAPLSHAGNSRKASWGLKIESVSI